MYKVIGVDQKPYGPVDAQQLRQWIAEGRVNAQTQVQLEGETEWKPLGTILEFAGAFATVPPSTPPPFSPMPMGGQPPAEGNGMAIAGLVLSIIGLLQCCTPLFSTLGLIFSAIALSQSNRDPLHRNRGLAIAGLVIALVGYLLFAGFLVFFPFRRGFHRFTY
jgi:hypothetical protein